jgi:hypothetical protein
MAETKKDAFVAFDAFVETWGVKYDKAVKCLIKDRDALLVFFDFPAEHWKHLRTTSLAKLEWQNLMQMCQVFWSEHKLPFPQTRAFAEAMVHKRFGPDLHSVRDAESDQTVSAM